MTARLLTANLQNDAVIIEEISCLLGELHEAWASIGNQPAGKTDVQTATRNTIEDTAGTGAMA